MNSRDPGYRQIQLFEEDHSLISTKAEDHWFDRKSAHVSPEGLANLMVGFANADGGTILVGVEKDGRIVGVDGNPDHLNRLRQSAINLTSPPVRHATRLIPCIREDGTEVRVLAVEVHPGSLVHRNNRDEVFLRVGDQNRKLDFEATQESLYDKGQTVFDGAIIPETAMTDLDEDRIQAFKLQLGSSMNAEHALKARGLIVERDGVLVPTCAAILLLSDRPE